ncbi:hypothetical protein DL93DRAFT_2091248 [Clavulina sp. PMI_390]|nr:hypothetical protein DL93DRAFT_2091248 [Clavulina sp. PMI_390]
MSSIKSTLWRSASYFYQLIFRKQMKFKVYVANHDSRSELHLPIGLALTFFIAPAVSGITAFASAQA